MMMPISLRKWSVDRQTLGETHELNTIRQMEEETVSTTLEKYTHRRKIWFHF